MSTYDVFVSYLSSVSAVCVVITVFCHRLFKVSVVTADLLVAILHWIFLL